MERKNNEPTMESQKQEARETRRNTRQKNRVNRERQEKERHKGGLNEQAARRLKQRTKNAKEKDKAETKERREVSTDRLKSKE